MQRNNPRARLRRLFSDDDGGLWMKTESRPVTSHTHNPSHLTHGGEKPCDESRAAPPAPAVITSYYTVMDEEGADVTAPPPPSTTAPVLPAEGSAHKTANNPSVTLPNGPADATEAKTNPSGLDGHHGERELMAAHSKVDEVKASTPKSSKRSVDAVSLGKGEDSCLPRHRDPTSAEDSGCRMETCDDPSGRQRPVFTPGDEETGAEVSQEDWRQPEAERGRDPQQVEPDSKESSRRDQMSEDADTHPNTHRPPCHSVNDKQQELEASIEVSNDNEEHVDTTPLDYEWVRRESGSSETPVALVPICEGSEEVETKEEWGDESRRIACDIQQGQELLQRLQQVALRQDLSDPESPHEARDVVRIEVYHLETREEDQSDEKENLGVSQRRLAARAEVGDSDDSHSEGWVPVDLSPVEPHPTSSIPSPFPIAQQRFSASEPCMEKHVHEGAQGKQNLQRASGVFNLADDPDVLEIPFKTNVSLEQPASVAEAPGQRSDWQFSEKKMQKEISKEIQRELVLVNQGKIPGGYNKGELRQLKETKLLFEAFQQDNTEGPTRHRKSPTMQKKSHIYPSVLERTRSLETLSLKSRPILRAQSLRMNKSSPEAEKSPDDLRSKSPTGAAWDKTRLSPYPRQDKHVRLHRSMDSISADAKQAGKAREGNMGQLSPILKQNPFYKLRPALALQPEVEKDIREARQREEELRRQRCTLYGESRTYSEDGERSGLTPQLAPDADIRRSRGKLERVWPPPSKKDQTKSDHTQQEARVHRSGGQKPPLWQRWESGLVNGQLPREKD